MDASTGDGDGAAAAPRTAAPLPRAPHEFKSAEARQAAGVLGALLKEIGALDSTREEIDAGLDLCRTLADLDPYGDGVPTRRLLEALQSRYPRRLLQNRLGVLMTSGAILKDKDVLNEVDVRLSLAGSLSLSIVPWITSMSGQRHLLEMLTRIEARATSRSASVADVRSDLVDLRRVLSTFANDLRRMVDSRKTAAMLEYARVADDRILRARIGRLKDAVVQQFPDELTDELESLGAAGDRYVVQQLRLLKLLGASRKTLGHWVRRDEVDEVMRGASLSRLASLWDGIAFDEAPYWLSPAQVVLAADDLTFVKATGEIPEPGGTASETEAEPPLQDVLRALAEDLLDGADERDLTPMLLTVPWPEPAVLLAQLALLEGLDIGYALTYPGTLATRNDQSMTRVVTSLYLRRVEVGASVPLSGVLL
ncbi:hypothetical protein SK803_37195 [Lentzea sp. BCCO 10_0856]|uniref:DUF3375 domain-containing protein n=1 Tax=Lentzea miocenica TaxID=3095431 RepID=A0ABU4TCE5_9PSEU|nr:hypothetical protein [Lentzea sp. BCCO 10_0856]MDX8035867.1 hypothetical protein [Lentzea sp. BCCO 10_0856]